MCKETQKKIESTSEIKVKMIQVRNMTKEEFKKTESLLADIMFISRKKGRPKLQK